MKKEQVNPLGLRAGDIITAEWASRTYYFWVKSVIILEPSPLRALFDQVEDEWSWGVDAIKLNKDFSPNKASKSSHILQYGYLENSTIIKRDVTLS